MVFTLAARICGSRELAEEVTLDVYHDVWQRSAEYDPSDRPVVGWIMNPGAVEGDRPIAIRAAQQARLPIHN